jgi:hypothetical protein
MNEQIIKVLTNHKYAILSSVVGVASFASGTALGYVWGKRNGDTFIINQSALEDDGVRVNLEEIDDYELFHNSTSTWSEKIEAAMADPDTVVTFGSFGLLPEGFLEDEDETDWETDDDAEFFLEEDELQEAILEQLYSEANKEAEEAYNNLLISETDQVVTEVHNVFANNDDQWVYEDELAIRSADLPYVIHKDEFVADEAGCDQRTVTYYEGDDIMANEEDIPMYDFNSMMGDLKWGHGSCDPNVVYIRNEKLEMEWEVLLHTGRFDVEVLGSDIEDAYASKDLKNSVQKFRDE